MDGMVSAIDDPFDTGCFLKINYICLLEEIKILMFYKTLELPFGDI